MTTNWYVSVGRIGIVCSNATEEHARNVYYAYCCQLCMGDGEIVTLGCNGNVIAYKATRPR